MKFFFGAIRSKGGCNNNPNAEQFRAAFKRLLCQNNVAVPEKANCTDLNESNMLVADGIEEKRDEYLCRLNSRAVDDEAEFESVKENLLQALPNVRDFVDDELVEAGTANISRAVQKEIIKALKCKKCLIGVLDDEKRGYSSKSLATICKVTEMELKILVAGKTDFNVAKYFDILVVCSLKRISSEFPNVFENLTTHITEDNNPTENHRIDLIKLIITVFLHNRLYTYSKHVQPFKQTTRNKLTKLILFKGD